MEDGIDDEGKAANIGRSIAAEVKRLSPPPDYIERGFELISTERRGFLRWIGSPSCCKLIGERFAGPGTEAVWVHFADMAILEAVGRQFMDSLPNDLDRKFRGNPHPFPLRRGCRLSR